MEREQIGEDVEWLGGIFHPVCVWAQRRRVKGNFLKYKRTYTVMFNGWGKISERVEPGLLACCCWELGPEIMALPSALCHQSESTSYNLLLLPPIP